MESVATSSSLRPLMRNALRRDVVVHLMKSVFGGTVSPGTRLIIRKLADQLGVSATPIREALVELEGIGIVQFVHNCGAVVKEFGPQELRDIYHLRRILETEATRCACGQIPSDELETLHATMRRLIDARADERGDWSQQAMAADLKLHDLVALHCGNARLADEIGRYNTLMQTMREIVGNRRQAQAKALEDHVPIVDALLASDAEAAATAMARHINDTLSAVESLMFSDK
jgi:DNA-binding GntR family transcriptional regulator